MVDLYPDPSWNYVFGQATFAERVGVQSFARYDPAFFDEPRPDDWRATLLRRAAQVLAAWSSRRAARIRATGATVQE